MDFKIALTQVCHDFSKDIIFQKRIISVLDDYGAFKDVPYYKLFYKTILNIAELKTLISTNRNEKDKAIHTFLAVSGLDETKVNEFLALISECYYDNTSSSIEAKFSGSNNENIQPVIGQESENIRDKNEIISPSLIEGKDNIESQLSFMSIPLGINFNIFSDRLAVKGFKRQDHANEIMFTGKFLSFDDISVQVFKTPISNIVYRIDVIIASKYSASSKIFNIVAELYVKRYGRFYRIKDDGQYKSLRFDVVDDEISMIKSRNDSIRIEYIAGKALQLNRHESKATKGTNKKCERDAIRNKLLQNIDDI